MGFEFRVLKERRQWALSSVSGPPCFGLCLCFARFSKNHKNQTRTKKTKKNGLFFSAFDLQGGFDPSNFNFG